MILTHRTTVTPPFCSFLRHSFNPPLYRGAVKVALVFWGKSGNLKISPRVTRGLSKEVTKGAGPRGNTLAGSEEGRGALGRR